MSFIFNDFMLLEKKNWFISNLLKNVLNNRSDRSLELVQVDLVNIHEITCSTGHSGKYVFLLKLK